MVKFTSILAAVSLVFSSLSLIAEAGESQTTVGNPDFPKGLVIPDAIAVDLTKNQFAFSLFLLSTLTVQCDASNKTWDFIGPVGLFVNSPDDLKSVNVNPQLITAVSFFDTSSSSSLLVHSAGIRSAVLPSDTSSSLFLTNATTPAPNPSQDGAWLRSTAFNQQGNGAFSNVTYLQRVLTIGGNPPPNDQCGTSFPDKFVYSVPYTSTLLFYTAKSS